MQLPSFLQFPRQHFYLVVEETMQPYIVYNEYETLQEAQDAINNMDDGGNGNWAIYTVSRL